MLLIENESRPGAGSIQRIVGTALTAVSLLLAAPTLATAQETMAEAEQESSSGTVSIELNKLEAKGSDCRAFFFIDNKSDKAYEKLQMEFFVFRKDGIIDQSFAADLAPLKANKKTVKRFDISNTSCDNLGSILINDVTKCQAGAEELSNCLESVSVSSRTDTEFNK